MLTVQASVLQKTLTLCMAAGADDEEEDAGHVDDVADEPVAEEVVPEEVITFRDEVWA